VLGRWRLGEIEIVRVVDLLIPRRRIRERERAAATGGVLLRDRLLQRAAPKAPRRRIERARVRLRLVPRRRDVTLLAEAEVRRRAEGPRRHRIEGARVCAHPASDAALLDPGAPVGDAVHPRRVLGRQAADEAPAGQHAAKRRRIRRAEGRDVRDRHRLRRLDRCRPAPHALLLPPNLAVGLLLLVDAIAALALVHVQERLREVLAGVGAIRLRQHMRAIVRHQ
jgi:hypothetical protein